MDVSLVDDLKTAIKNKEVGIREYLNNLPKIWVTPFGVFSTLKQLEDKTGTHRRALQRRFNSKLPKYDNWYIIDGNSELSPAEDCSYCDELDDALFYEGCWLCHVEHVHRKPLKDNDKITYLYQGEQYVTTLQEWVSGHRIHKELGEFE